MISLLVFVYPDHPAQLAIGALITFFLLVINLSYQPFCMEWLNSLQNMALRSQFLTPFIGIMLALMSEREKSSGGETNKTPRETVTVLIVLMNATTIVWPFLRGILRSYHDLWHTFVKGVAMCCSRRRKKHVSRQQVSPPSYRPAVTPKANNAHTHQSKVPSIEAEVVLVDGKAWAQMPGVKGVGCLECSSRLASANSRLASDAISQDAHRSAAVPERPSPDEISPPPRRHRDLDVVD